MDAGVTSGLQMDGEGRRWVEERARAAGFELAGVAAVAADDVDDQRFAAWVGAGYAGEMGWLTRADAEGRLLRGDVRRSMPWAKSVVVCALNYNARPVRSVDAAGATQGWIARYAWSGVTSAGMGERDGADYHDVLMDKLRVVEGEIRQRYAGVETRCYVDTGPIVERGYAARAGVGWIGKNTCVLNEAMGSWLLLGVVVTSLELLPEASVAQAADRCGSCTRCIEACPTNALMLPTVEKPVRAMDASRCIAYLTIEKKGVIEDELKAGMGRQVFGCDICQDVCPWNRRAPVTEAWPVREALVNPELEWMAEMDGPTFNRWFRGSPLERTRRRRVLRNVAVAMGNSGETKFLPRLREWAAEDDAGLGDAARWAVGRLEAIE